MEAALFVPSDLADTDLTITASDTVRAYAALAHLEAHYPGFRSWYWDKVVPGLGTERRLDVARREGRIVGITIAKRTVEERKLCSVWIVPSYRRTGLGVRMMFDAMAWLDTARPVATVSEDRIGEFGPLLRRMGFHEPKAVNGLYRPGVTEYVYHG